MKKGRSPSFSGAPTKKGGEGDAPIYLGGVPEEETLIFDGPDISWELEWEEFKAAIREKREPLGSGRDGLEANRMIAAVYLSAKESVEAGERCSGFRQAVFAAYLNVSKTSVASWESGGKNPVLRLSNCLTWSIEKALKL